MLGRLGLQSNPGHWSSLPFNCPKCARRLIFYAHPAGEPQAHIYWCEAHGFWSISHDHDFLPLTDDADRPFDEHQFPADH